MKTAVSVILLALSLNAWSAENTISTKADAVAPPAAPKYAFGYSIYHYDMRGSSTARTNIYRFGDAHVEVQLYTLTYNASPKWTLMAVVPYLKNVIETQYLPTIGGPSLTDYNEGLSDVRFMAIRPLMASANYISLLDVGFTAPTGNIDTNFTSNPSQRVSYNMQLGSGTPDVYVGLTQLFPTKSWWMQTVRLQYAERLGRNYHGWALGSELQASAASKFQIISWLNAGAQANFKSRGSVRGRDNKYEIMNNFNSPVAKGDGHQYYHSSQSTYDLTAVVKAEKKISFITGGLEVGVPLWQDARNSDNIRLDTKYYVSGSASAAF